MIVNSVYLINNNAFIYFYSSMIQLYYFPAHEINIYLKQNCCAKDWTIQFTDTTAKLFIIPLTFGINTKPKQ